MSTDKIQTDYEAIIVGAGPSGCACAVALHGSGLRNIER